MQPSALTKVGASQLLGHAPARFRLRDIRSALPGVSDPTIKRVLGDLRRDGLIELAEGQASGPQSAWRRTG